MRELHFKYQEARDPGLALQDKSAPNASHYVEAAKRELRKCGNTTYVQGQNKVTTPKYPGLPACLCFPSTGFMCCLTNCEECYFACVGHELLGENGCFQVRCQMIVASFCCVVLPKVLST